jgi:hypothetical protein
MMEDEETEFYIFRSAHQGDLGPLIELLSNGAEITPERRGLILKILRGDIKRPPHRQKRMTTQRRLWAIAGFVRERENSCKQMAAIAEAMKKFNCSEKTVKNALKRERAIKQTRQSMETAAQSMIKGGDKAELFHICNETLRDLRAEYVALGLRKFWNKPRVREFK